MHQLPRRRDRHRTVAVKICYPVDAFEPQDECCSGEGICPGEVGTDNGHRRQGVGWSAGAAVLEALEASVADATRPTVLASRIVSRLDAQHAFLVNRNKIGSMALPGESLFVLEMQPASYAIVATNEAEKAASVKVVDYRMVGATGRVYLSGREADVRAAAEAAEGALA